MRMHFLRGRGGKRSRLDQKRKDCTPKQDDASVFARGPQFGKERGRRSRTPKIHTRLGKEYGFFGSPVKGGARQRFCKERNRRGPRRPWPLTNCEGKVASYAGEVLPKKGAFVKKRHPYLNVCPERGAPKEKIIAHELKGKDKGGHPGPRAAGGVAHRGRQAARGEESAGKGLRKKHDPP